VLESKRKKRAKTIILLAIIWFVISLPLPWLFTTPDEVKPQTYILLQIVGLISIPFIVLAIAWTIKPELTT
jgi:Na+-driven multidrug efflux pump